MEQSNLGVIIILAGMIILGLALYFWESQVVSKLPI